MTASEGGLQLQLTAKKKRVVGPDLYRKVVQRGMAVINFLQVTRSITPECRTDTPNKEVPVRLRL